MDKKQIGLNIKESREKRKMTQEKLAEYADLSTVHVSHLETGKASMSMCSLLAICDALNVTPNEILLGEYPPPDPDKKPVKNGLDDITHEDKLLLRQILKYMMERNGY